MTNDIEGLRKVAEEATNSDHDGRFAFRQAATPQVVLALLSELEAVKGERDGWRRLCGDHQTAQDAAEAALVSLKRENARLFEANVIIREQQKEDFTRAQAAEGGGGSSVAGVQAAPDGATEAQHSAGLARKRLEHVAKAIWFAEWEDPFPRNGTIEHAIAMQQAVAATEALAQAMEFTS